MTHSPSLRSAPVGRALSEAARQGGVLSRPQLYALGVTRSTVRAHIGAGRWQRIGDQSVHLGNGALSQVGEQWAAVFQGGPRACLDGASALIAAGLDRYEVTRIRVSVPRGARNRRTKRFDIRQTRRWSVDDIVAVGVPRTRPATAAVRAGLWASTDRQAAYVVTLAVQQGIAAADDVGRELLRIRRDRRRALLHAVVNDLLDGAKSLGELDVGRELRRRGLPEPERQVLRKDHRNRYSSISTGPGGSWSSRSTGSTTPGRRTSSATPCARTPSRWTATPSSGSHCSGCASSRTPSSPRSSRRCATPACRWPRD
ncbi:MAG: hypothetical protein JWN91_3832 [Nocardioides sp.]|nr:hypothetical protein [Nocardioides sp.]